MLDGHAQSTVARELGHNRECNQPYGTVRAQALAAGHRQVDRSARGTSAHIEECMNEGWCLE